jgi:16S rRNA (adenine1518-N6/adenine1519-N6)-dimethyltransferase
VNKFNKKSLGQNFLIDQNIKNKIIGLIKIQNRNIIEIGPGNGALTDEILKQKPKSVITIEKDNLFHKKLQLKYSKNKIIKNLNKDILKFDIEKLNIKNSIILGNLPYNISSQILVKIIKNKKWPPNFSDVIFMFQKELGEKILGKYPSNNYGRISILTNYRLYALNKFYVSHNCFFPRPKVDSVVIHFKPIKKTNFKIKNISNLEKITNILFSNKRKMINKNIKKILNEDKVKMIGNLNLELRPSKIEPDIYYKIAELYEIR